ncbi:MAG: cobalt-precorrin 5A hydrolase [Nitrospinota bacterium]
MAAENSIVILYITEGGYTLSKRLVGLYPGAMSVKYSKGILPDLWKKHNRFIFIMATGIVVRSIANLLKDKRTDPGVVVLDEKGRHAISLVSGHLGGANRLAKEIAGFLGSDPVITTASDTIALPEIIISNRCISPIPSSPFTLHPSPFTSLKPTLYFRSRNLVVGIGCKKGITSKTIEENIIDIFEENNLSVDSIRNLATIDKKQDEKGLTGFSDKYSIPIVFYTADELNRIDVDNPSPHVIKAVGAKGVAEPAAVLSSNNGKSLLKKIKRGDITLAIREANFTL